MGPRSHERGNSALSAGWEWWSGASMGPRSHERGNVRNADSPDLITAELQWGRVLTNAETRYTPRDWDGASMLQWGRVLTNAETPPNESALHPRRRASMGPRSHERGNHPGVPWSPCLSSASMGPRSHERGNWRWSFRLARRRPRFNGAAFSRTRKPQALLAEPLVKEIGFNGAAFSRTRKRSERLRGEFAARASMGPRSHERGNSCSRSETCRSPIERFNGAAFSRTRKLPPMRDLLLR